MREICHNVNLWIQPSQKKQMMGRFFLGGQSKRANETQASLCIFFTSEIFSIHENSRVPHGVRVWNEMFKWNQVSTSEVHRDQNVRFVCWLLYHAVRFFFFSFLQVNNWTNNNCFSLLFLFFGEEKRFTNNNERNVSQIRFIIFFFRIFSFTSWPMRCCDYCCKRFEEY